VKFSLSCSIVRFRPSTTASVLTSGRKVPIIYTNNNNNNNNNNIYDGLHLKCSYVSILTDI